MEHVNQRNNKSVFTFCEINVGTTKSVILSKRSASKDLRTLSAAQQVSSAKILRLRSTPLRMTDLAVVCHPGTFSVTVLLSSESVRKPSPRDGGPAETGNLWAGFLHFFLYPAGNRLGKKSNFSPSKLSRIWKLTKRISLEAPGAFPGRAGFSFGRKLKKPWK